MPQAPRPRASARARPRATTAHAPQVRIICAYNTAACLVDGSPSVRVRAMVGGEEFKCEGQLVVAC